MATVTLTVCDVCDAQNGVATYTVEASGRIAVADLCEIHAAPLIEFIGAHAVQPQPTPKGGRGNYRHAGRYRSTISSLEEIEAVKKAEAAARKAG